MMNQNPIAIDIVLLPVGLLQSEAITTNKEIDTTQQIPLNLTDCLPHITLAMAAVAFHDLEKVYEQVNEVIVNTYPQEITVSGIYNVKLPDGRNVFGLDIHKNDDLFQLHCKVAEILEPFRQTATIDSLDPVRKINKVTLAFINQFYSKSSYDSYHPHITLGFGKLDNLKQIKTLNSTIFELSICQLANYCTCSKVLKSFPFKSTINN